MEQYRNKIKNRMVLLGVLMLVIAGIMLYSQFGATESLKESLSFSFQCGLAAAGSVSLAFLMLRYRRALADEAKLRLLYNQENDERMKAIRAKAGVPMVLLLSMALVLAGMVIGYWNETIFVVLICVALFQLLASLIVKFYYMKKM